MYSSLKINNDCKFLVLEYAKYGDLNYFMKILLKRRVLSETALNYFGKQILEGIEYIHRCKIVHMDIKPGNILIDSNLDAKITDFSVSCSYLEFHPEDTVKFPFAGTGKYIAPEILSKSHLKIKEAEKIDIYSFGVTLYYLFYGEYPYNLKDIKEREYDIILKKIQNEKLTFPENIKISNLCKDFLEKVLEKDYTKRFNINQALNHPWIKGSEIIFNEKEYIINLQNFLINLITNNIEKFNEYIK
jgi:serine/threonine protein kinase